MSEIQLIVIDLDGTLLNAQKEITARNIEAIRQSSAKGIKIAIASGRLYPDIVRLFNRELQVSGYKICLNGSYILNEENQVISKTRIERSLLNKIFEIAYDNEVSLFCNGLIYSVNFAGIDSDESVLNGRTLWVKDSDEFNQKLDEMALNIYMFGLHSTNLDRLKEAVEDLRALGISMVRTETYFFEGANQGINKFEGIKQVVQSLGISTKNILAIGDQENDFEMIRNVGFGVAMGNAIPAIKSVAKYITNTNERDGVAQIIHDLILKEDDA